MTAKLTTLACALRRFFTEHLPQVRGASPHTVRSYRDSLALLLRFAAAHASRSVAQLDLDALTPDVIVAFLQTTVSRHGATGPRPGTSVWPPFMPSSGLWPACIPSISSSVSASSRCRSSAAPRESSNIRIPRDPAALLTIDQTTPTCAATTRCSPRCLILAPASRKSSTYVPRMCSWSRQLTCVW